LRTGDSALLTTLPDQGRPIQLLALRWGLASQLGQPLLHIVLHGGGCGEQVAQALLQGNPTALLADMLSTGRQSDRISSAATP
jgi:hypothetical protein